MEEVEAKEREARRRRKIVERGSDRMAFITGRIQTLSPPSPPSSSSSNSSHTHSLPPLPIKSSNQIHSHKAEDDASGVSSEHHTNEKFSRGNAFKYRNRGESRSPEHKANVRAIQAPDMQVNKDEKPLPVTPRVSKVSADMEMIGRQPNFFFTAKKINSCIVTSESTRVFCSVTIALLVVLSNVNLSCNIVKSKSTIASRPLYILLLTDVMIVLVKLLEKRRGLETNEQEGKLIHMRDGSNWAGAVNILELGLVFYQTTRAVFIDFSFYTVVVICGLSMI